MHPDFNPPGDSPKLTGRRSTITGLFFTSLTPYIEPSDAEVDKALEILGMSRGACVCAYCGDKKSEWDHFRAVVKKRKPTGYITEIANLVPACGKCNQSRGNKDWRAWMQGKARHSPTSRGVQDVRERMQRLEAYEAWSTPIMINYEALSGDEGWSQHLAHLDEVLSLLERAEQHASKLRALAKAFAKAPRNDV
jgi:HNH endonuclease